MRIGSLWTREKDGQKSTSGTIQVDTGINLPAGMKLSIKIVKNNKKDQDNQPDAFIEAWIPKAAAGESDIPF